MENDIDNFVKMLCELYLEERDLICTSSPFTFTTVSYVTISLRSTVFKWGLFSLREVGKTSR